MRTFNNISGSATFGSRMSWTDACPGFSSTSAFMIEPLADHDKATNNEAAESRPVWNGDSTHGCQTAHPIRFSGMRKCGFVAARTLYRRRQLLSIFGKVNDNCTHSPDRGESIRLRIHSAASDI